MWYAAAMGQPRRCLVSFRDEEGVEHVAEVLAGSLTKLAQSPSSNSGAAIGAVRHRWTREHCVWRFANRRFTTSGLRNSRIGSNELAASRARWRYATRCAAG